MTAPFDQTPDWVYDAVFYQIFPDRFGRSERVHKPGNLEAWDSPPTVHGYKGGDLLAVAERLDYLEDLGVNALYLTPVFQSASNHRYHTHDYYRVDPMLGGDAALRELLERAHDRGMRVLLDGVFNHASRGFFQFNDILENGKHSAYVDWFKVHSYPHNAYGGGELGYDAWWGLPALPKFNTATPDVREFLLGVSEHWLRFGADGWRLDVPSEIDDDAFWREFRRRCRAVRPDAYFVGEIWHDADRWLAGDMFDGVMNYPLTRAIFGLVGRRLERGELAKSGLGGIAELDAPGFAASLGDLLRRYKPSAVHGQLNLLGSHDTPRVATSLGHDDSALRLAYLLMFTLPGAPCVYYGDELGLRGGHDPHNRGTMPWDEPQGWNEELRSHVSRLARLRHDRPELRRGEASVRSEGEVVVIERSLAGHDARTVVLVNAGEREARLEAAAVPSGSFREALTGRPYEFGPSGARGEEGDDPAPEALMVPARGALVLTSV